MYHKINNIFLIFGFFQKRKNFDNYLLTFEKKGV